LAKGIQRGQEGFERNLASGVQGVERVQFPKEGG
jgi:hypothetical protein